MPRINLDDGFFGTDKRFDTLAELAGEHPDRTRMRVLYIWRACYERKSAVLEAATVDSQASWTGERPFGDLMVQAKLARLPTASDAAGQAGASRGKPTHYFIHGVLERIKYLVSQGEKAKIAAEARWGKRRKDAAGHDATDNAPGMPQDAPHPHPQSSPSPSSSSSGSGRVARRKRAARTKVAAEEAESLNTRPTWEAYATAFAAKYGHEPVRNARVNSCIKSLVKRLGERDAPQVAAFYLKHRKGFYVEKRHDVGLLLQDAEALYSQWKTGKVVTRSEAMNEDRRQTNGNAAAELAAEYEAEARKHEQPEPEGGEGPWSNGGDGWQDYVEADPGRDRPGPRPV